MAQANIPPYGPLHDSEVIRQRQKIAQVDPVEAWKLRRECIDDAVTKTLAQIARKAQKNHITRSIIDGRE